MRMIFSGIIFISFVLTFIGLSFAQSELIVFPKDGQNREQQSEDKGYCNIWAREESGIDPAYIKAKIEMMDEMIVRDAHASREKPIGRIFKTAAKGAALGGIRQGIDSDVGAGAAGGAAIGIFKSRDARKKSEQEQRTTSQHYRKQQLETKYDKYLRAYSACMDAKGYSVR